MDMNTEILCFGLEAQPKATMLTEPGRWLCHHGTIHHALRSSFSQKSGMASEGLSCLCCSQSPSHAHVICGLGTRFCSSWGNLGNFVWLVCDLIEVTWLLQSEMCRRGRRSGRGGKDGAEQLCSKACLKLPMPFHHGHPELSPRLLPP